MAASSVSFPILIRTIHAHRTRKTERKKKMPNAIMIAAGCCPAGHLNRFVHICKSIVAIHALRNTVELHHTEQRAAEHIYMTRHKSRFFSLSFLCFFSTADWNSSMCTDTFMRIGPETQCALREQKWTKRREEKNRNERRQLKMNVK